jgi:two-component system, NtrC family, sensor histidine kinase PilS
MSRLRALLPGGNRRRGAAQVSAAAAPEHESLFGALVGRDSQMHDDAAPVDGARQRGADTQAVAPRAARDARPSVGVTARAASSPLGAPTARRPSEPGWAQRVEARAASNTAAASEPVSTESKRLEVEEGATLHRLFRVFVGARAVLGASLVAALVAGGMFGMRAPLGMMLVSMAYAAQAVVLWMLPRFRQEANHTEELTRGRWIATIGVDLVTFSILHWMQPTQNFNFVALLLMPVLMGGVLATRTVALAGSSAVVLILLAVTWNTASAGGDMATLWLQSGLAGIGFFAVTLLAGEMSSRLASQALAARSGLELARQQAQLNRLVLEEMTDGVLVVDRRLRVRAANPAGRRLLVRDGLGRPAPFQLSSDTAWADIEASIGQAFAKKSWPTGDVNVTLKFSDGMTRTLRMRARFTRRRSPLSRDEAVDGPAEIFCVVFVEDLRAVHDRTRQEKLAAMGRVSAGIAHEIRNPLAAIAQANALLSEEVQGREQQMLTRMVNENVERLKLIVDDVMAVAPGHNTSLQTMDANAEVGRIVAEWSRSASLPIGADTRLRVELPSEPLPVIFDAEHVRRVLVNLLDNARRYATDSPGAMTLHLAPPANGLVMLSVASDGDPIPADIEPYLFEPFFSTRSRGTGLGLYICRELCERHGASIDYWQHPPGSRHVNEFRVVFRVAEHTDFTESRLLP